MRYLWKHPNTGIWYYRREVPEPLRASFGARWFKKSLRTTSESDAAQAWSKYDQEYQERAKRAREAPEGSLREPTGDELAGLVEAFFATIVQEDEDKRKEEPGEFDGDIAEGIDIVELGYSDALAKGDPSLILGEMEMFLEPRGFRINPHSDMYQEALWEFSKAFLRAIRIGKQRQHSDWVDSPIVEDVVAEPNSIGNENIDDEGLLALGSLLRDYLRAKSVAPRTAKMWETAVSRFEDQFGSVSLPSITRTQAVQHRAALQKYPSRVPADWRGKSFTEILSLADADSTLTTLASESVNKALAALSAIVAWYLEENPEVALVNPFAGLRLNREATVARQPFEQSDLEAIFGTAVYIEGARPKGGCGEAAYWVPVLALYTGGRLGELGQLHLEDIRERSGTHFLDINDRREGASLKTSSSARMIPLHPELIKLGFLRFVEAERKERQSGPLFPSFSSASFSKWFSRQLRDKAGINDKGKVFHSFRHTYEDHCLEAGMDTAMIDSLLGHARQGMGARYGKNRGRFPLSVMGPAIATLPRFEIEVAAYPASPRD